MTTIESIKSAIRFDDYAGRYLDIKNGKSTCPVHKEKTASFVVHERYGKCFGCGWHCDVIAFAAEFHGITTGAAIRLLADEAGITLTRPPSAHPYDAAKAGRLRAESGEWRLQMRAALIASRNADDWDRVAPFMAKLESMNRVEILEAYTVQRTPEQAASIRDSIRESDQWEKAMKPLIGTLIDRLASAPESEFVPEPEFPEAPYGPRCW